MRDRYHGKGKMVYKSGSVFEGIWADDERVSGTYTLADGRVYVGELLV